MDKPAGYQQELVVNESMTALDIAKMALESANVGIWVINAESRKFIPSNRTKELFGFKPEEEMSFENAVSRIPDKHRQAVLTIVDNAFKQRSNLYVECPVLIAQKGRHVGLV